MFQQAEQTYSHNCSPNLTKHIQSLTSSTCTSKFQKLIKKIINFKDYTGQRLINKYSISYFITLLDKNKIQSIDRVYKIKQDGFNLLQFIRFFLNVIDHSETQTLYLTMGLVDLFKTISQVNNLAERIKFVHFTDYICSNILQNKNAIKASNFTSVNPVQNRIQMKLIPNYKAVVPDYQIKQYIINPPTIYGNKQETVYKVNLNNAKVDKNKHYSVVMTSYFSFSNKKILSLDVLSDSISIYDTNCRLQKKLRSQNSKIKKDVVILSFAYSHRQQRIGAVMKDFTLSFWDFSDNLQFQKTISTASTCQQYQQNIWYFEYFQSWATSNKTGTIYLWNLEKQIPERKIECKYKGKVNDVCEIPCLNILAVAQEFRTNKLGSSKKQEEAKIILYNYFRGEEVGQISSMNEMRIPHTLQYSETYQVLLSAGFQKKINIYEINHRYLDTNLKGELLGHQNLITNFTLVKKTPMVVSSDDKGNVKIWDLRNYKCVQTLDFRDKTIVTKLLDMVEIGKLGVLGTRINFLDYDNSLEIIKKYQSTERNTPLWINYIYESNNLLIVTKKDVRLYNMQTGSIERILCDYHNKDQQIVQFCYYEVIKKVAIGNQKGEVKLYNLGGSSVNEKNLTNNYDENNINEQKLQGFQNGVVTHIQYDQDNKLFITCGGNGTINIQKIIKNSHTSYLNHRNNYDEFSNSNCIEMLPSKKQLFFNNKHNALAKARKKQQPSLQQWTIIRQMNGNFHNKGISTLAFSVYHGMIAIGSNCSQVYVWDYESAKILFEISLPVGAEPTSMQFLNGFSILIIGCNNGEVYFLNVFESREYRSPQSQSQQSMLMNSSMLFKFKDNRIIQKTNDQMQILEQQDFCDFVTDILVDIRIRGKSQSNSVDFSKVYLAYSSGNIAILELTHFLSQIPIITHRKNLPNYNPERQIKQNFQIQLQKQKCLKLDLKNQQNISNFTQHPPYKLFKSHHGSINSMKIIQFDQHILVTCGNDERVKIWEENSLQYNFQINSQKQNNGNLASEMRLISDFNVNHILPYLWNFSVKQQKKIKDKIMFSLKIIQSIFKKFGSDISINQSKLLKLQTLFKVLSIKDEELYMTETMDQIGEQNNRKKFIFQQQFSKKDLHYDKIKKFNFYEIGGPSLRELQFQKKLELMQKEWQSSKKMEQQQKNQMMSKIHYRAQKNEQKQQIINFLQDRQIKKIKKIQNDEQQPFVKKLTEQLKKIEIHQSIASLKSLNVFNANNDSKISGQQSQIINKLFKNIHPNHIPDTLKFVQQKSQYGNLRRKQHANTKTSNLSSKQKYIKTFEQYYQRKIKLNNAPINQNIFSKDCHINTDKNFVSSLPYSRNNSRSSLHQNDGNSLPFQSILKDLKNRVLFSRQARHLTVDKADKQLESGKFSPYQKIMPKTHYLVEMRNKKSKFK